MELVDEIEMSVRQALRKSYSELQSSWTKLADSAFGGADPRREDEMSRGEFTSVFISERDLTFPASRDRRDRASG